MDTCRACFGAASCSGTSGQAWAVPLATFHINRLQPGLPPNGSGLGQPAIRTYVSQHHHHTRQQSYIQITQVTQVTCMQVVPLCRGLTWLSSCGMSCDSLVRRWAFSSGVMPLRNSMLCVTMHATVSALDLEHACQHLQVTIAPAVAERPMPLGVVSFQLLTLQA